MNKDEAWDLCEKLYTQQVPEEEIIKTISPYLPIRIIKAIGAAVRQSLDGTDPKIEIIPNITWLF